MRQILSNFIFVLLFLTNSLAFANNRAPAASFIRYFKKITIPGATCGQGQPYYVFFSKENSRKLAIEFMGGGACWNEKTCFGITELKTLLLPLPHPLPNNHQAFFSPLVDHSYLYFPYCTGDIFSGDHIASYGGQKVYHKGKSNVRLALDYLSNRKIIDFGRIKDLALFGSSAGALGALLNAKEIESRVPTQANKVLIADSPGLHFGPTFWSKFPSPWIHDLQTSLNSIHIQIDTNTGLLAHQLGKACLELSAWNVGFIQSTMDIVMSSIFGDISPVEHRKLVLGKNGLKNSLKNSPNCSYWIPDSPTHAFLIQPSIETIRWVTAFDFSNLIIYNEGVNNFSPQQ